MKKSQAKDVRECCLAMKEHLVIVVCLLSVVLINRADSTGTLDQLSGRTEVINTLFCCG